MTNPQVTRTEFFTKTHDVDKTQTVDVWNHEMIKTTVTVTVFTPTYKLEQAPPTTVTTTVRVTSTPVSEKIYL